ncbi:uncharacterized protein [Palaemon carinicauda]|uniref:uncharacterized protein n=1 Tax=Palaemon carinicauda TaxID=392227 RepID=UPI0035B5CB3D
MTKQSVLPKRHSSGFRILPMILTMTGVMMILIPEVENAKDILYQIGEVGTRGSEVLAQSFAATSRSTCAGACLSDGFRRTAIQLEFSCPTCVTPAPSGGTYWEHRCEANAVAVGIASLTSFPDLDYLLCGYMEGLQLDLSGGYTFGAGGTGCSTYDINIAFDSVWSNNQYYDPPSDFRICCRSITTGQKIDLARCIDATETYGYTSGISSPLKMLLCPPHMVAQKTYASSTVDAYVYCCLLYTGTTSSSTV